jgi:hypothetical protein
MTELKTVTITRISRKDKVSQAGKSYVSLGLQTQEYGDKWLSGFDGAQTRGWKEGDTVEIEIEQKGVYLNFNVPRKDSYPRGDSAHTDAKFAEVLNLLRFGVLEELSKLRADMDRVHRFLDRQEDDVKMPF